MTVTGNTAEPLGLMQELLEIRLKKAEKLVKKHNYQGASELYNEIYEETGCYIAGYNAALMAEALGNTAEALLLMQELLEYRPYLVQQAKFKGGSETFGKALERLQQLYADEKKAAEW